MKLRIIFILLSIMAGAGLNCSGQGTPLPRLHVSGDGRFFTTGKGEPFFWLGDTGWLLFTKLNREEADRYLQDRREKGYTVIQVMVLHALNDVNVYGDPALVGSNAAMPMTTPGSSFGDSRQYDFWDHADYIIDKAAEKGMYIALVPIWGSVVKSGRVSRKQAKAFAGFLANRYKDRSNIVWMNGGDIKGSDSLQIWNTIGTSLRAADPEHLISFHPRGRASSSSWFHQQGWLDFNSVQSGHRSYEQDTSAGDPHYGEDNWKYIRADYHQSPVKPVLDAEPSYEQIPHGLHDSMAVRWTDKDVRRYGYWSVFAGACGYTYGDNAVMQFYRPGDKGSYGVREPWYRAIDDAGAGQMFWLKQLMLSRPYFERVPDESLVADQGERYNYLAATRGKGYAFIYTCNGRTMTINMGKIAGDTVEASWYSPRDGSRQEIGLLVNKGLRVFTPPAGGDDWVLMLDAGQPVYLFTSFREPATDGLYLLSSTDGFHWTDLGGPWIKPLIGDKRLMRDPSMVQGPDGVWRLVWTSGWTGDKGFGYASSADLVHWSEQRFIPVMQQEAEAVNVWAPEIFYEKDSGYYVIVWATTIPNRFARGQEDEKNNHRLYYTTTRDFVIFSPAKLFFDPGYSVIDATIVQRGQGDYVLVFKDNTRPQRNIKAAFGDRVTGPYHDDGAAFTPEFTEGPTVARVGQEWMIYYDMYREKKYGAMETGDFIHFTDITNKVSLPVGHKHGTIIMTDRQTLTRLKDHQKQIPHE